MNYLSSAKATRRSKRDQRLGTVETDAGAASEVTTITRLPSNF